PPGRVPPVARARPLGHAGSECPRPRTNGASPTRAQARRTAAERRGCVRRTAKGAGPGWPRRRRVHDGLHRLCLRVGVATQRSAPRRGGDIRTDGPGIESKANLTAVDHGRSVVQLQVKGKNVEVTDSIRQYAEEKLGRLGRQLAAPTRVGLGLRLEKNPSISANHVAEATIWTKGPVLRAREANVDMKASIDQLVDKLERQVKRYREKRRNHRGSTVEAESPAH